MKMMQLPFVLTSSGGLAAAEETVYTRTGQTSEFRSEC